MATKSGTKWVDRLRPLPPIDSRAPAGASFLTGKLIPTKHMSLPESSCPSLLRNNRIHSSRGVAAVATARPKLNAKAPKGKQQLTESQIAVHCKEEDYFLTLKELI